MLSECSSSNTPSSCSSLPSQPSTTTTTTTTSTTLHCTKCGLPLDGEFVRALDGTFHWGCFSCLDCNEPVASRFFPIEGPNGTQEPLCERDYFRRLNLVCAQCGDALRGPYITAVDKKFHLEHFGCCVCSVLFGPDDSYYEHDNKVYCHYHYSIKYAMKCTGCQVAILKQFVEINRNNVDEHWHPECYMIHRFWNVKIAQLSDDKTDTLTGTANMTPEQVREVQVAMEDKVYRIWTVLSAFEESAAACISDMLLHVSEGSYIEGLKMADYFVTHVEVLFTAIDDLVAQYHACSNIELQHERDSKMLTKKIINFFTLLSHTQETGVRRMGITEELLSLVTGLAHYLKVLIRISLTAALKLESMDQKSNAISRFLSQLVELANKRGGGGGYITTGDAAATADSPLASERCRTCNNVCDDQCFRFEHLRWHDRCFACSKCCAPLRDEYRESFLDPSETTMIICKHCAAAANPNTHLRQGFVRVSQLQQFSFLLRFSLRRLYTLLNVHDAVSAQSRAILPSNAGNNQQPPGLLTHESRSKSYSEGDKAEETINLGDIKRVKSTHTQRKMTNSQRVAKRSTLMETPSPNAALVTSGRPEEEQDQTAITTSSPSAQNNTPASNPSRQSVLSCNSKRPPSQEYSKTKPVAKFQYIAELSALNHFMVKHVAVLHLEELLKDHFTLEDLVELIDEKKHTTLWGKFFTSLKGSGSKKNSKTKEGTFGVPLDVLVERTGVESNLGCGASRIKIPAFIDESISAMKQMDMSVEGIFRKNGNIRRLKELSDEIDNNPNAVHLANENPIQVAALTKKFLRELPEPLLTFKLHKLFTVAQQLESEADKKRVLHLACCLLPKPNRDTLEVLFLFLKWVSTFAEFEDGSGSKMDLHNLATVLAPNILYPKHKDPAKEDSHAAISTVYDLLQYQEEFAIVPEDLALVLKSLSFSQGDMEASARDVLRKCETVMRLKKSNNKEGNGSAFPAMPTRQHSSPAAMPTLNTQSLNTESQEQQHAILSSSPIDIHPPPALAPAPPRHSQDPSDSTPSTPTTPSTPNPFFTPSNSL